MMKFFVVAILFAFTEAGVIVGDTNCVSIRDINYEKEILKSNLESPYQLAIDHDTNTLFFSYTARNEEMFKTAYLSLKTGEYGIVSGIHEGFANAVNSKSGIVYMGGEDGIYQFNYDTKIATNLHIITQNANVWQMFYKDGLYFTTYPEEKAYLYKNGEMVEVPEVQNIKVMIIAVNNDNNIVYHNSSGLYMNNKAKGNSILLNSAVVNGITADIEGNLYFSNSSGIYYLNDKTKEVEELAKIDNIYGVAIESNGNIIYASEDSIIRLKPSKKVCIDSNMFVKNVVE